MRSPARCVTAPRTRAHFRDGAIAPTAAPEATCSDSIIRRCSYCRVGAPWPATLTQPPGGSVPPSNTRRLLARDHAAPESTLALTKATSLGCGRVRPLAWCSRPRSSAALLEGALMLADAAKAAVFLFFVVVVQLSIMAN